MKNQEIRDAIRNKAENLSVPDSLQPDQIEKKLKDRKQKKISFTIPFKTAIAAAASLAVICAAGFGLRPILSGHLDSSIPGEDATAIVEERTPAESPEKNDTTYKDICNAINKYNEIQMQKDAENDSDKFFLGFGASNTGKRNASDATTQAENEDMAKEDSVSSSGSSDHSETDTQVQGIMEGDIVKTDGRHIFTIRENTNGYEVSLYRADGAQVEYLSQIRISQADCREMYIEGSTLIILGDLWDEDISSKESARYEDVEDVYSPVQKSHITLYDISDPAKPKAVRQLSQSGSYNTSRISGGYLYTFTNYTIAASDSYKEEKPDQFMPQINGQTMNSENVRLLDKKGANSYMVMTSLKLGDSTDFADSKAILGQFDTYYMNQDHIYAVNRNYRDYASVRSTIIKYTYDKGVFHFQGDTRIRGEINNSYYMHEYRDHFVFVYTRVTRTSTVNGLCILDENLKLTGELSDLGVNETIYASYFIDNMAYFVTYRNTDPVFAVDISNPSDPVLKSELKLPGFSSYLHSFGKDMLIGIGSGNRDSSSDQYSDIEEINPECVKLSLFSIDKDNEIREIDKKLAAPETISCAGDNHKAVFIDEERQLAGLAIGKEYSYDKGIYVVYQCKKGRLKKVLSVSLPDYTDISDVRGLRIGEYFYVVDTKGGIKVFDINTWKKAK